MSIRSSQYPLIPIHVPVSLCYNHTKLAIPIFIPFSKTGKWKTHVFSKHRQGFECCILSLGGFPGVWILYADVSEQSVQSAYVVCTTKDGKDRVSETCRYESTSYLLTWSILTSLCRDSCNYSGRQKTAESLVRYRGFHATKCDRFKNFVNCAVYQILG
jgi:hypothetical protein